jgi:DNA-binding MarR family transcriptional regulator
MALNRIDTLFELYSIGRKFRSLVKHKNSDTMLIAGILRALVDQPLSISHLGTLVSMKPSAMSEKVGELVTLGFVEKRESDDERESLISISAKGKQEIERTIKRMQKNCDRVFHGITDEEMRTLVSLLNTITGNL